MDGLNMQLSGDLPWVALGWKTYPQHGLEPSLIAIYGPVDSREEAAALVATLLEIFPGDEDNYTVMPLFKVRVDPDAAVTA